MGNKTLPQALLSGVCSNRSPTRPPSHHSLPASSYSRHPVPAFPGDADQCSQTVVLRTGVLQMEGTWVCQKQEVPKPAED